MTRKLSKPKPATSPDRFVFLLLLITGDQPRHQWSCMFHLQPHHKTELQLWLVRLPSPCADPQTTIAHVGPDLFELKLRLSGPVMPAAITNCNDEQQKLWAQEAGQTIRPNPTTIAIFAGKGKINVTIR